MSVKDVSERRHRCGRCKEEFICPHGPMCSADYEVMPNVITPEGRLKEHCPINPDWAWIRSYGDRMRAQGHIDAARAKVRAEQAVAEAETAELRVRTSEAELVEVHSYLDEAKVGSRKMTLT